jgi:diguanylate cyclase (GGDEF)-like protein
MKIRFSMNASLWLTIVMMGLLGMALAITTGNTYRELMLEQQRAALADLIKLKTGDLLENLKISSAKLGIDMQREPAFRDAFEARDQNKIVSFLNNEFHRYFETAGILKLEKLYVFDLNYSLISESTAAEGVATSGNPVICADLVQSASQRKGADRLKTLSTACLFKGKPHFAVLTPIGGLHVIGYIAVVTDPSFTLARLEPELGLPLKISALAGTTLYASAKWPSNQETGSFLIANHAVESNTGKTVLQATMASDMKSLNDDLGHARNVVLIAAGIATLLTGILALFLLQRTAVRPLKKLAGQIRRVLDDRSNLGEQVSVSGIAEVHDLASNFNTMTAELKALYDKLDTMAFRDDLTGLPNRSLFNDRVQQIILICERQEIRFALLMMDLNRFKQVNDSLGHSVGDELLQQVAARLLSALRKSDSLMYVQEDSMLARLGGDEFAVLLPMVSTAENTSTVANRLQKSMDESFNISSKQFNIGISIGIAMYPDDGEDTSTLMRHADIAMYQAKRSQRGFAFYDSADEESSIFQLTFESDLRSALENDELEPYFQPKISCVTGAVCGAETLLRWQHPGKGLVMPDTFIPLAEQTGLMQQLTAWVIDKSLEQCAVWHRAGFPLPVSVNLSPYNLRNREVVDFVLQALKKWDLRPASLCLEITEGAVMENAEQALAILKELDAIGVSMSIDDFGTGYSSLSYLQQLPVDELKIDKSFVIRMGEGSNDDVIIRSTIDLAHNMKLQVVAEGVETQEVADHLKLLGCDVMQGYFFSRPVPAIEFFCQLSEGKWRTHSSQHAATASVSSV